jgi:hypothetical protein
MPSEPSCSRGAADRGHGPGAFEAAHVSHGRLQSALGTWVGGDCRRWYRVEASVVHEVRQAQPALYDPRG